jgi:hypothetical protein
MFLLLKFLIYCVSLQIHLCKSSSTVPYLPSFVWKCCKPSRFCIFKTKYTILCTCLAKQHLNLQKWSEPQVFCISQLPKESGPIPVCFLYFNFEIYFVPQPRILFLYLNFQKLSKPNIFYQGRPAVSNSGRFTLSMLNKSKKLSPFELGGGLESPI